MIEEIRERLPLYEATVTDNLHYQMVEDISSLLILFDAQKSEKENNSKLINYIERKYGIVINRTDLDNFLKREL